MGLEQEAVCVQLSVRPLPGLRVQNMAKKFRIVNVNSSRASIKQRLCNKGQFFCNYKCRMNKPCYSQRQAVP